MQKLLQKIEITEVCMKKSNKQKAFTLAETLFTLAIVGVVAALTVPTLKQSADEATHVAAVKKAYAIAKEATTNLEQKEGDLSTWPWNNTTQMNKLYQSVMTTIGGNAWRAYQTFQIDGSNWAYISPDSYFMTSDGMTWYVYNWNAGAKYGSGATVYGCIHVDTNGPKEPNALGVDVHAFTISSDGVNPMGDGLHDQNKTWACTNYAIMHSKMPWLKGGDTNCYSYYEG